MSFCWFLLVCCFFCLYVSVKGPLRYFLSFAHIFSFIWLLYSICACWFGEHDVLWMFCLTMLVWGHMPRCDTYVGLIKVCTEIFQRPWFGNGVSFHYVGPSSLAFSLLKYFLALFDALYIVLLCSVCICLCLLEAFTISYTCSVRYFLFVCFCLSFFFAACLFYDVIIIYAALYVWKYTCSMVKTWLFVCLCFDTFFYFLCRLTVHKYILLYVFFLFLDVFVDFV